MAVLSHYEDIVDLQVDFLTGLLRDLKTEIADGPALTGSGDIENLITNHMNLAFKSHKDHLERLFERQIATAQNRRPAFIIGEQVVVLNTPTEGWGNYGLVVEVTENSGAAPDYVVLLDASQELQERTHGYLRPAFLYQNAMYAQTNEYIIPKYAALEPADPVAFAEVIHTFGKYMGLLKDAVKAADQIHKHTDKETEEQKDNAKKTRGAIIEEIMGPLNACRSRMVEEGLVYVHGRFYRVA